MANLNVQVLRYRHDYMSKISTCMLCAVQFGPPVSGVEVVCVFLCVCVCVCVCSLFDVGIFLFRSPHILMFLVTLKRRLIYFTTQVLTRYSMYM